MPINADAIAAIREITLNSRKREPDILRIHTTLPKSNAAMRNGRPSGALRLRAIHPAASAGGNLTQVMTTPKPKSTNATPKLRLDGSCLPPSE